MLRLGIYNILKFFELLHVPKHLEKSKRNTNSSAPQETFLWGAGGGGGGGRVKMSGTMVGQRR